MEKEILGKVLLERLRMSGVDKRLSRVLSLRKKMLLAD
jgi:hypothetical protein